MSAVKNSPAQTATGFCQTCGIEVTPPFISCFSCSQDFVAKKTEPKMKLAFPCKDCKNIPVFEQYTRCPDCQQRWIDEKMEELAAEREADECAGY